MQQVQQGGGRYGGCGGRTRARIKERQFTKDFAGSKDCKQGLAAVIRGVAQLVGASRETVNKSLADFVSRGWIRLEGRAVTLLDVDRLARRAR